MRSDCHISLVHDLFQVDIGVMLRDLHNVTYISESFQWFHV